MCIWGADHIHAIDRMCVGGAGQRRALDGCTFATPHVPQDDLSRVRSSYDVAGVELTEGNGHDWTLQMEPLVTAVLA